ncbi:MAG: hypothetical protein ACKORE_02340, partial [Bacteroidota bacterium]
MSENINNTNGKHHPYTHYLQEYEARFRSLSDAELTAAFNSATGIRAWNFARAAQMDALIEEFERRRLDWSVIGNEHARSLKYCVFLIGKSFYRLTSVDYCAVHELLERYLNHNSRTKNLTSVELLAYDNSTILYRLKG